MPTGGRKTLSAETLHHMDGGNVGLVINHAIDQAIRDVQDRPGDKTVRKVAITLELKPKMHEQRAELEHIATRVKAKPVIPERKNREPYLLKPSGTGSAEFQPTSPYAPEQDAFQFDPETGEVLDESATDDAA